MKINIIQKILDVITAVITSDDNYDEIIYPVNELEYNENEIEY
jgi:hypothetical protein